MYQYSFNKEEKDYLSNYDITDYKRPSLATDMTIFSIMEEGKKENIRQLQPKALKLLLVKRATYPFKDKWVLPGGFCRPNEDIYETAQRELKEETGIDSAYLKLMDTFGEKDRDPRGWIISNTFLSLINGEKYKLRAGADAWEAKWFSIFLKEQILSKEIEKDTVKIETEYTLSLYHQKEETSLSAKVKETKIFKNYHETIKYDIVECEGIGFDHAKIIVSSFLSLKKLAKADIRIVFDLLPEYFTFTELQNAFELVLGHSFIKANFRRKMKDYVIETECKEENMGYRPAVYFKRNLNAFYDN